MKTQITSVISLLIITCSLNLQAATPAKECKKLFDEASYQKSIPSCTQAAEAGNNEAQTMLGEAYDRAGDSENTALWCGIRQLMLATNLRVIYWP